MLEEEAKRTGEDRLDFVVVAASTTPTTGVVKDIIAHGFHIVCATNPSASPAGSPEELKALAQEKDLLFGIIFTVMPRYAILEQAKKTIADGVLGKDPHHRRRVSPGDWAEHVLRGKDGLTWRVDPAICGLWSAS